MKQLIRFSLAAALFGLLIVFVLVEAGHAQSQSTSAGPYDFKVGLTAGYRNSSITDFDGNTSDWAKNRFYEAQNLRSGILLNSFDLYGERVGSEGFFDELFVTANGINDPFTTGSLRLRQFNSYDLKVDFRQAKYFMNRNDSIFTGLHKYDMTRDFLNASLDVHATDMLTVNAKFNSVSRSGSMTTTVSPFMEDAEELIASWMGGMFRANFYWLDVPKNDKTTEFSAGLTAKLPANSSVSLGAGLRSFTQEFSPTLVDSTSLTYGGVSANAFSGIRGYTTPVTGKPNYGWRQTPLEVLHIPDYTDHRESSGPFAYLQGVTKPIDEVTVTADVRYEKSESKPWVKYQYNGFARTGAALTFDTVTGAVTNYAAVSAPYNADFDGLADELNWNTLTGNVGITGHLMDGLSVTVSGGMSSMKETTKANHTIGITADTGSTAKTIKPKTASEEFTYTYDAKVDQTNVDAFVSYSPEIEGMTLGFRAGVKYLDRKPEVSRDEVLDSSLSRDMTAMTPYVSVNFRPIHEVRFDGRFSTTTRKAKNPDGSDAEMVTHTYPDKITTISGGIEYEPVSHLELGVRYLGVNSGSTYPAINWPWTTASRAVNLPSLDFTNNTSSFTGSIGYFFNDLKLGINVSGQYKENKYEIPVTWTRGNYVPATDPAYIDSLSFWVKQNSIDRYVDLSLNYRPLKELYLEGGFSLLRSTGEPSTAVGVRTVTAGKEVEVVGDTTRFGGPYKMQTIHVAASYDVTQNVGVNVDFQQLAYKEDKIGSFWALNNFKSSLFRGGFSLKF